MVGDPCKREGCQNKVTIHCQAYCSAQCAPFAHLISNQQWEATQPPVEGILTMPVNKKPIPDHPGPLFTEHRFPKRRGRPPGSKTLSRSPNAEVPGVQPFVASSKASDLVTTLFLALDQAGKLYLKDPHNQAVATVFNSVSLGCQEMIKYHREQLSG